MNGRGSGLSGEQIEFLLLLSRTHSLTRTASALGLSVATVSRMLGAVREIFDDELFVRSGNSMAPTRRMTALVPKLERARAVIEKEANALQVKMELQADCFAGVWGHFMEKRGILETGDLEEALKTATAIGDDRLQKEATGRVVPDSFTHGTSLQRLNWFKKGFKSGNPNVCNTWQADKL